MGKSKKKVMHSRKEEQQARRVLLIIGVAALVLVVAMLGGLFLLRLIQKINMPQEIERKFLVKGEYKSQAYSQNRIIRDISAVRATTVRVRIRGKGYLTIKGASDASGISRYEWEKEIPLNEAEELMKLCEPGVIHKPVT